MEQTADERNGIAGQIDAEKDGGDKQDDKNTCQPNLVGEPIGNELAVPTANVIAHAVAQMAKCDVGENRAPDKYRAADDCPANEFEPPLADAHQLKSVDGCQNGDDTCGDAKAAVDEHLGYPGTPFAAHVIIISSRAVSF